MALTRHIPNILTTALVPLAMSFLVSCSGTANEADPDSPEGVVENFYESLGSGECDEAMRFLLFERSREIEVFIRNTVTPGLLGLMLIEIKESRETVDTQEPVNFVPDAGMEIVPPPGP